MRQHHPHLSRPAKSRLVLALLAASASATPVMAQQSPPNSADENATTLPEIQVQAQSNPITRYPGGQIATGSRVGMLGDKDFMETPFSTVSYTDVFYREHPGQRTCRYFVRNRPDRFQQRHARRIPRKLFHSRFCVQFQ